MQTACVPVQAARVLTPAPLGPLTQRVGMVEGRGGRDRHGKLEARCNARHHIRERARAPAAYTHAQKRAVSVGLTSTHAHTHPQPRAQLSPAPPNPPKQTFTRRCEPCLSNQYLLNSSNPAHRCRDCPAGATCNGSALTSRVPGALWTADAALGLYVLQSCPPSYYQVNADDSTGAFSQAVQVRSPPSPIITLTATPFPQSPFRLPLPSR